MKQAAATLAVVLACAGLPACGRGKQPLTFNPVPTAPATAPATAEPMPTAGSSDVTMTGEVNFKTTQNFECSYAIDDFFIRGRLGLYEGVPLYFSLNVEFYKRPGPYPRRTQILLRRINEDQSFYASWYEGFATATVLPNSGGADLVEVTVQPEPGTQSTKPVRIGGHFGCAAPARPGPG